MQNSPEWLEQQIKYMLDRLSEHEREQGHLTLEQIEIVLGWAGSDLAIRIANYLPLATTDDEGELAVVRAYNQTKTLTSAIKAITAHIGSDNPDRTSFLNWPVLDRLIFGILNGGSISSDDEDAERLQALKDAGLSAQRLEQLRQGFSNQTRTQAIKTLTDALKAAQPLLASTKNLPEL